MKISVSGGKGGTGKSMVATALAIEFSEQAKTLLVDADVECPNDHLLLNIKREKTSEVHMPIPQWDMNKCTKCGKCATVCKPGAIVFVKGRYPAFVSDVCIGCRSCIHACPTGAITESKKQIGTIYIGENHGVQLIAGELKLGELASGEVVSELRSYADTIQNENNAAAMIIDSAAGIGCPVIASIVGSDYLVAVTEPTPSALHDLKRVIYLGEHFKIKIGIVINKHNLDEGYCNKIETYAQEKLIPIIGKIPYSKDFVRASIQLMPVTLAYPEYKELFKQIARIVHETIENS